MVCLHFCSVPWDPLVVLAVMLILKMEKKKLSSLSHTLKREQELWFEMHEARKDIMEENETEFSMVKKRRGLAV